MPIQMPTWWRNATDPVGLDHLKALAISVRDRFPVEGEELFFHCARQRGVRDSEARAAWEATDGTRRWRPYAPDGLRLDVVHAFLWGEISLDGALESLESLETLEYIESLESIELSDTIRCSLSNASEYLVLVDGQWRTVPHDGLVVYLALAHFAFDQGIDPHAIGMDSRRLAALCSWDREFNAGRYSVRATRAAAKADLLIILDKGRPREKGAAGQCALYSLVCDGEDPASARRLGELSFPFRQRHRLRSRSAVGSPKPVSSEPEPRLGSESL